MAKPTRGYIGWAIDDATRARLLSIFPPAYPRVVAHHCTLEFGVTQDHQLPSAKKARVVGQADDLHGVQAIVLEIDGTTFRPDGQTYHITWSLEANRKPVESNQVIASNGYTALENPVEIDIHPKFFPMGSK